MDLNTLLKRNLSVPDYYGLLETPPPILMNVSYVVSPEIGCISEDRFTQQLLDPVTDLVESRSSKTRKARSSSKSQTKSQTKSKTKTDPNRIIKIY